MDTTRDTLTDVATHTLRLAGLVRPAAPPDLSQLFTAGKRTLAGQAQRTTGDRCYWPNQLTFHLSPADHTRLLTWKRILEEDLNVYATERVQSGKVRLPGGRVSVCLAVDPGMQPGSSTRVVAALIDHNVASASPGGQPAGDDEPAAERIPVGPCRGLLHFVGGGQPLRLVGDQLILGRGDAADLIVDDDTVSRRHCLLTFTPQVGWTVLDLDSLNGTFVEGGLLGDVPTLFADGQVLTLGAVDLRLDISRRPLQPTVEAT